ncbi:MAG: hypothetical protein ACK2T3_11340 [Candidatus Promineifilaceae bacterium]
MRWKLVWKKPLLTITQLIALLVILFGLFVALDLNRRAQAGRDVGQDEETLQKEYDSESRRQVELLATLEWVRSPEYVSVYAYEEGGLIKPGEKRIVVIRADEASTQASTSSSSSDPAQFARPWQAWWQLLTDSPMPVGS